MRARARTHVSTSPLIGADDDDDAGLFVVYSPPPKNIHARHPATVDANSGGFLIGTAQNTHVKWTKKKCFCGGGGGGEDGGGLSC